MAASQAAYPPLLAARGGVPPFVVAGPCTGVLLRDLPTAAPEKPGSLHPTTVIRPWHRHVWLARSAHGGWARS